MSEEKTTLCWQQTDDKNITASCTFNWDTKFYCVKVSCGELSYEHSWHCSYIPTFGMDVSDHAESVSKAEELAVKIEQELGI